MALTLPLCLSKSTICITRKILLTRDLDRAAERVVSLSQLSSDTLSTFSKQDVILPSQIQTIAQEPAADGSGDENPLQHNIVEVPSFPANAFTSQDDKLLHFGLLLKGSPAKPKSAVNVGEATLATGHPALPTLPTLAKDNMNKGAVEMGCKELPTSPGIPKIDEFPTKISKTVLKSPKLRSTSVLPKLRKTKFTPLPEPVRSSDITDEVLISQPVSEDPAKPLIPVKTPATSFTASNAPKGEDIVMAGTDETLGSQPIQRTERKSEDIITPKKRAPSTSFSAPGGSQSKDVLISELKAMKIVRSISTLTRHIPNHISTIYPRH